MADTGPPIAVGSEKQLFIDDRFIEESDGLTFSVNQPHQYPEPLLVADRPWEGRIGSYNSLSKEGDLFRLWYDVIPPTGTSDILRGIAYATSHDGLHWTKPNLNLIEFQGSTANNLVAPPLPGAPRGEMEGAAVFKDTNPSCSPEERYKLWTKIQRLHPEDVRRGMRVGLWAMYSEDGIRWKVYDRLVDVAHCDTQNVPFWDERVGMYVGYGRTRTEERGRGIGRLESADFQDWSEMQLVFQTEQRDLRAPVSDRCGANVAAYVDIYTNACMKYPFAQDAYFMMPSFLYHWDCEEGPEGKSVNFPDTSDVRLLTSRDGVRWHQPEERKPFLRLGPWGSLSSKLLYASPGVIRVGDELWHYYKGANFSHSGVVDPMSDVKGSAIFRAVSRLDGFVSIDAPYDGGSLTTPPVVFEGTTLTLNVDTGAGGIVRAEIQSANGRPLEGYTLADSDEHNGNSVRMPVRYRGSSDIGRLAGVAIRLHLQMYDCKLYAFQFTV